MDEKYNDYDDDEFEPTPEEWAEIEHLIIEEEQREIRDYKIENRMTLNDLKAWCKENGILW